MSLAYVRLLMALVAAFAFVEFMFPHGGFGLGVPVTVAVFYGCVLVQGRVSGRNDWRLWAPMVLSAVNFVLFDNDALKFFNFLFLFTLLVLHTTDLFGVNAVAERFSWRWFVNAIPFATLRTLEGIGHSIKAITDEKTEAIEGADGEKKPAVLGKVLIGVILSLPVLLCAGALLVSADAAFEGAMTLIYDYIKIDWEYLISRLIPTGFMFFAFLGYFGMLSFHKSATAAPHTEKRRGFTLDFVIAMTMATLLGGLYLVYLLSQMGYLVSAFGGILPANYTHSEYARRGFFEMLPIAFLNMVVVGVLQGVVSGRDEAGKRRWLLRFSCYFAGFTVFFIVTALAKMGLYVEAFGLTIKRVYVSWFLVLLLIVHGLVFARLFAAQFRLVQTLYAVFVVMFLGLIYSNVDYVIARYNVAFTKRTGISVEDSFRELSFSAAGPFYEMVGEPGYAGQHREFPYHKRWREPQNQQWERFNFARARNIRVESEE